LAPGFGVPFVPELNVDRNVLRNLRAHLEAIREAPARMSTCCST
jgi:hypothetical protein